MNVLVFTTVDSHWQRRGEEARLLSLSSTKLNLVHEPELVYFAHHQTHLRLVEVSSKVVLVTGGRSQAANVKEVQLEVHRPNSGV